MQHTPFYARLYIQVLAAIAVGIALGFFFPDTGAAMKPLGDGFIKLIKMMIAPIIFATVVMGIANIGDLKEVGRVGMKALLYFEVVSILAMVIGMVVVNLVQPGAGMNIDVHTLDTKSIADYAASGQHYSTTDFFMNIIPATLFDAFSKGEILQVLLISILTGISLTLVGERGKPLLQLLELVSHTLFGIIGIIMKLAPIGAFGAMAFTIGKYGIGSLHQLGLLMLCMYGTCALFVVVVLGLIAKMSGFSIWKFLKYIQEEVLIVLGTSSSESVLPRVMVKMTELGCTRSVVGLVIPTGYSFNLDGTSIYLTMAAIFIAQATNVHLSLGEQLSILMVLMLTSKGAGAVVGAGFITLAATLATLGGKLPVEGLALLVGIDRFMAEARSITNIIGNCVATVVIAKWEGALDVDLMRRTLDGDVTAPAQQGADVAPEDGGPAVARTASWR